MSKKNEFKSESCIYDRDLKTELDKLGLTPEDIDDMDGTRGSVQKGVLKILAKTRLIKPDDVINLAARVRKEKQRHVDEDVQQLKYSGVSGNGIKLVIEACGVNVERWRVMRIVAYEAKKNGLKLDDLIEDYITFCGDEQERWSFARESVGEKNWNVIIAIPALAEEFGDDLPAFKLIVQDIETLGEKIKKWRAEKKETATTETLEEDSKAVKKAGEALCKIKKSFRKDPNIFHIYAELAKSHVYHAEKLLTALVKAEDVHENTPELMEICSRVLKTSNMPYGPYYMAGGFSRLAVFKKAKPLYGQNPGDANDVADMVTTDYLSDTLKKSIDALLAEMERFRENPRKKALFINLAKKGSSNYGTTAISLLARMDNLLQDDPKF